MARPAGSTNADHDEKRAALLGSLLAALLAATGPPSLRALARAAGVTVPTLRHYFGDRDAVLAAVFAHARADGAGPLRVAATPDGPAAASVAALLRHAAAGLTHGGVGRLNELGLREGLANPAAGAAYRREVLDPTLDAFAARLAAHAAAGELDVPDPRAAALELLAPLLMHFLHQTSLGGAADRPLDGERLIDDLAAAFVRGRTCPFPQAGGAGGPSSRRDPGAGE